MTNEELAELFTSDAYRGLLEEVCVALGLSVNDSFPEVLYDHDRKKLDCAGLASSDLIDTVTSHRQSLLSFAVLKFRDGSDDLDGEFPPGETPGKEDRASLVQAMPMYRNFLLAYIIEFTILSTRPESIVQYLKCVRIPQAATYAKQLNRWFIRARSSMRG